MTVFGSPELDAAMQAPMKEIARGRVTAWTLALGLIALAIGAGIWILAADPFAEFGVLIFLIFLGGYAGYGVFWMYGRRVSRLVMPHLASAAGLEYQPRFPDTFVDRLAGQGLIPRAVYKRRSEDWFQGTFGTHTFEAADLRLETGGKNSKALFTGLIVWIEHPVAREQIIVTQPDTTQGGFFSRALLDVSELSEGAGFLSPGDDRRFQAFSATPQATQTTEFKNLVQTVLRLDTEISGCRLFSIMLHDGRLMVALEHDDNWFRIVPVFGTTQLQRQVQIAFEQMQDLLAIVQILLDAAEAGVSPSADDPAPPEA